MLSLRLAFVVLLYLFLFSLVAAIRRDLARAARTSTLSEPASSAVEGRLIVLAGGSSGLRSGHSFQLAPVSEIGRASGNQIRLEDELVSAHHARLRRRDGHWFIEDLHSTNGTLLNQQPIQGEQPVEYGDVIGFGDVRLKLAR